MAATHRTQLLMEPEEFKRLKTEAHRRGCSVAELIRSAVRQIYLEPAPPKEQIVEAILSMKLPKIEWERAKKDIESAHANLH
jgi:hypothetical protein